MPLGSLSHLSRFAAVLILKAMRPGNRGSAGTRKRRRPLQKPSCQPFLPLFSPPRCSLRSLPGDISRRFYAAQRKELSVSFLSPPAFPPSLLVTFGAPRVRPSLLARVRGGADASRFRTRRPDSGLPGLRAFPGASGRSRAAAAEPTARGGGKEGEGRSRREPASSAVPLTGHLPRARPRAAASRTPHLLPLRPRASILGWIRCLIIN